MNNMVKETRLALKLTQMEMADAIGCSFSTERRCERESRLPSSRAAVANLRKLAKKAGVGMEEAASTRA